MIVPDSGPKLKLVEAAEKLFAANGFDVVSVRDITQAAGSNVAAVNYHFGSRDDLVAVVMTRYLTPVNEARLAGLEAVERNWVGQAVPVEEVIDAFVRPLITRTGTSDLSEALYFKLVGRIFSMPNETLPAGVEAQVRVVIERFIRALGMSLPSLKEEELLWRLHFVVGAMIHLLIHGETVERVSQGTAGTPDMEAGVARLLGFAVAGLRDGVSGRQTDLELPGAAGMDAAIERRADIDVQAALPAADAYQPVLPPAADAVAPEADQKSEKKSSKRVVRESPQVMFNFG
jgi:AcrR family transcriptional regulator